MFRSLRIAVLLVILLVVAVGTWQAKMRIAEWDVPLRVVVYPIAGDDSAATRSYVASVDAATYQPVERYVGEEAERYGIRTSFGQPLRIRVAPRVDALPPPPPIGGNVLQVMWWSLALRWWAWSVDTYEGLEPDVQLFVVYHDPRERDTLEHSLGLEKGRIGVVNAFASDAMAGMNNVVVAHELLHTLGASDKYDAGTMQPVFPDGYARPDLEPRHPQRFAEIMAGRIPVSDSEAAMPPSLNATLIGEATAREINWVK
ncbi:MAG: hypothetical protein AB1689_17820 [Thermodesulfobacteriota bacterium]